MKHIICSLRSALFGSTLALSALLALGTVAARADTPAPAAAATSQSSGPLVATFDKSTDADKGPYILTLKNNGDHTLKVTAVIQPSTASHNDTKEKTKKHSIKAGQSYTISNLAAGDKVNVSADGVAPLALTVP
ncbi:MAG TPA: hypothetical protein VIM69_10215 [Opitutaceae bacterium]